MRFYLLALAIILLCVCFQDAWPYWLRLAGQSPALVVAVIACLGLLRGAADGCLAGLVGALLLAGSGHVALGGLSLSYMALGASAGLLRGTLFAERLLVAVLIAAVGVIATNILQMLFVPPREFVVWLGDTLASAAFTALVTPLLFWLARLTKPPERLP